MKGNGHKKRTVFVCRGTGCISGGGDAVYKALQSELAKQQLKDGGCPKWEDAGIIDYKHRTCELIYGRKVESNDL